MACATNSMEPPCAVARGAAGIRERIARTAVVPTFFIPLIVADAPARRYGVVRMVNAGWVGAGVLFGRRSQFGGHTSSGCGKKNSVEVESDFDSLSYAGRFSPGPQRGLKAPSAHGSDRFLVQAQAQPFYHLNFGRASVGRNDGN